MCEARCSKGAMRPCVSAAHLRILPPGADERSGTEFRTPNVGFAMKLKRNGPLCYRCGGMKHRRDPEGRRWCRTGCLPSGKFLNQAGEPTAFEQRAAACARVAAIRSQIEESRAWQEARFLDWVRLRTARLMASAITRARSLRSMAGKFRSAAICRIRSALSSIIRSGLILTAVRRARSPARSISGDPWAA